MHKKHILIGGGGIAGLSAALAFNAQGHEVVLCEQHAAGEDVGAGIQISPNGMKVLRGLGLEQEALLRGVQPQGLEMRLGQAKAERVIFNAKLGKQSVARWGAPYLHIHRADIIDILANALAQRTPNALRYNTAIKSYTNLPNTIGITLADGRQLEGDMLVGADGLYSIIRAQMLGADKPRFTGNMAWRAVVPAPKEAKIIPPIPKTACVWVGARRHAVTYYLRGGELINFVGVVERDSASSEFVGDELWMKQGKTADMLADFDGWHPTLRQLIEQIIEQDIAVFQWPLYDRAPVSRWHDGRAILIGDAAHPALPFMAQGANMALEDSFLLARMADMLAHDTIGERFYALREQRTSHVQKQSYRQMKIFHRHTALAQAATYAPIWLAAKLNNNALLAQQDWLYKYDATQVALAAL